MKRLSSPIEEIKAHYTVVVVGSGYGGAITASRLARAGQSVCVLERGKEFQSGDFPDSEARALGEVQADLPSLHLGSPLGMYDLRVNDDVNVVVGCGLGGTSLINANVALRADPRVFADGRWPRAFRDDVAGLLEEGYSHAAAMLKPAPYQDTTPPLAKLKGLQRSAQTLGAECTQPPINVCFTDGINHVGVEQRACNLCGDCVSGCNHGAKNSLNMNYLPDARNHGAELYTEVAVQRVEQRQGRWLVHFQTIGAGREAFDAPAMFVSADVVILAAGSLGSTEILLRSRASGLAMSDQVGKHFSSNGDVLGFGYNNDRPMNGVGFGDHPAKGRRAVGPCITGLVDMRATEHVDDGIVIEEGALPGALGRFLPIGLSAADALDDRDPSESLARRFAKWWREILSGLLGPYHGAVRHTQTYLVMAHDDGAGVMTLCDDRLRIAWPEAGKQPVFRRIDQVLVKATRANGGEYVPNPVWSELVGHELVTVHPLGGATMADDAKHGAVNHKGQLFLADSGTDAYAGLYVCDGAVMPRSLGVNPLLTISAIAERCAALIARDRGWTIDYALPSVPPAAIERTIGIRFTETMAGTVSPLAGGPAANFRFILTIAADDLDALIQDPNHRARMTGTVTSPLLDSEPLVVTEGEFGLLMDDRDQIGTRRMTYRMKLTATDGRSYFFDGYKVIRDDHGLDLWADTTTLYITLHHTDSTGPVLGRGVLRIAPQDFLRQLTTMQAINAEGTVEELGAIARFGRCFAGSLFDTYGGVFAGPNVFDADAPPRRKRPLRAPTPQVFPVQAIDGVTLRLTRYRGGSKGPVMLAHGLGVSSTIFTIDTIDTNLLEFLAGHGYDVWLLDFRASIELPTSTGQFTADDVAMLDYPVAVEKILQVTGAADLQVVAHCFGSATFIMAMLAGLKGVRSAVCSQVAAHMTVPLASKVKTGLHLPSVLDALGVDSLTAYVDNHANWLERLYDKALSFMPTAKGEQCNRATCHRVSFMYAPLYLHAQLNTATHDALHEMFGIANITAFKHLALMVREGRVVSAAGADTYLTHPERLAIPILFIHGSDNRCFLPQSTETTYQFLSNANGPGLYTRQLIPDYGHIDCIFGKNAARDVYGHILEHLDKYASDHGRGNTTLDMRNSELIGIT